MRNYKEGGTIGQTVCMCECAEIAQGKHKLAWELNRLSTVPLSESPTTSQLHVPFFSVIFHVLLLLCKWYKRYHESMMGLYDQNSID